MDFGTAKVFLLIGEEEMDFYASVVPDTFFDDIMPDSFEKEFLDGRIIVDCDPHGFSIMLCYQHGSKANAFQGQQMCPLRSLTWAALHASDLNLLNFKDLILLTKADYSKLLKMVKGSSSQVVKYLLFIRKELQVMMHSGYKAEMQSLSVEELALKSIT